MLNPDAKNQAETCLEPNFLRVLIRSFDFSNLFYFLYSLVHRVYPGFDVRQLKILQSEDIEFTHYNPRRYSFVSTLKKDETVLSSLLILRSNSYFKTVFT